MGAGYGGINGRSITYQERLASRKMAARLCLTCFPATRSELALTVRLFELSLNSVLIDSHSFTDLASAQAFFSNNLIGVPLLAGLNTVEIELSETMSSVGGFSSNYAVNNGRQSMKMTVILAALLTLASPAQKTQKTGCGWR
jgi:hypothetical protein